MNVQSDFLKNLLRQNNLDTLSKPATDVDYLDTRENEDFLQKMKTNNESMLLNFDFGGSRLEAFAAGLPDPVYEPPSYAAPSRPEMARVLLPSYHDTVAAATTQFQQMGLGYEQRFLPKHDLMSFDALISQPQR